MDDIHLPTPPVRYDPSFEHFEPDEVDVSNELVETLRGIMQTTARDYGHAVRSVHAKSHGVVRGQLKVADVLPPELAQGIFAAAASYPVVMRFSTNPGDILDDSVSLPRGLALKVVGVPGERLPDSPGADQDFVMVNAPAFSASSAKAFLANLKMLAKTTDTPQFLKKAVSAALRGAETVVEAVGGKSPTLMSLGGHPNTHVLSETFYTQAPLLYGPYVAKFSVAPISASLKALVGEKVDVSGRPNALREELAKFFATQSGEWELRVQLMTNPETMPIEDASVPWPEQESPYIAVGRISVAPQDAWSEAAQRAVDDGMAFSPWHGIADHRPLGSIMRVRKPAYEMSSGFRSRHNRCPITPPRVEADLNF
jgi:catalase